MNSKTNNVALIIHTCDRYEFLYKGFQHFFAQYWDFAIRCNYYFITEEKKISVTGFENIQSGKGEWADRLSLVLKEKITENYILYFQEDMWLSKKVNKDFFNTLFETAEKNNWQQVKLHSSEVYKTSPTDVFIEGFNVAEIDNKHSDFLMSHQVTLWNKDFLLKQLHKNEHPWRNERKATQRLKKINPRIFHIDYFAENGSGEINRNNSPVLRSEYNTVSINGTLHGNIGHYIRELSGKDPADAAYATELQLHFDNHLTHDGLKKPRKVDIIKKIRNYFRKPG